MPTPFAFVLLGVLVVVAVAAVMGVVLRKLRTSPRTVSVDGVSVERPAHEPVWEDRYRHHARQAPGWPSGPLVATRAVGDEPRAREAGSG